MASQIKGTQDYEKFCELLNDEINHNNSSNPSVCFTRLGWDEQKVDRFYNYAKRNGFARFLKDSYSACIYLKNC